MWQRLYMMWRLGATPWVMTRVRKEPGVARVTLRVNRSWTRLGRPRSRLSRMTSSKNSRPRTGASNTWVRLTSIWRSESRVGEASGVILRCERQREPLPPAIEERLDVRLAEAVADGLKSARVATAQEAVVQGREGEPTSRELPLRPLVAVEAALEGIRGVAVNLDEGRAPLGVDEGDGVMVHADRFPAIGKVDVAAAHLLGGGPGVRPLLRDPHQDYPGGGGEPIPVALDHVILAFPFLELEPGNAPGLAPRPQPSLEGLGDLPEHCRRGDRLPARVQQEAPYTPFALQARVITVRYSRSTQFTSKVTCSLISSATLGMGSPSGGESRKRYHPPGVRGKRKAPPRTFPLLIGLRRSFASVSLIGCISMVVRFEIPLTRMIRDPLLRRNGAFTALLVLAFLSLGLVCAANHEMWGDELPFEVYSKGVQIGKGGVPSRVTD